MYKTKPGKHIGKKFGMLTIIAQAEKTNPNPNDTYTYWLCRCDCGNTKVISYKHLTQGHTISCGCYRAKKASERASDPNSNLSIARKTAVHSHRIFKPRYNNIYGYPGIKHRYYVHSANVWEAKLDGIHIGTYPSLIDAISARMQAEKEKYGFTYASQYYTTHRIAYSPGAGIWYDKKISRWRSSICFCGKKHYLGTFYSSEGALAARKDAEEKLMVSSFVKDSAK